MLEVGFDDGFESQNGNGGLLFHPVNYDIFVKLSRFVPAYQCIPPEILKNMWYLQVMSAYPQIVSLLKIQKF